MHTVAASASTPSPETKQAESQQPSPQSIIERWQRAKQRRSNWESHWQECYDYALPQRDIFADSKTAGAKRTEKLFDGTAADCVDQLAASLLSNLTPPWGRWFGLTPGAGSFDPDRKLLAESLEKISTNIQSAFDRSNFAIEVHQCYLDLVTAGTACLLFEEGRPGDISPFHFTAIPLSQVAFEENAFGQLETTFRRSELTLAQLKQRFPGAAINEDQFKSESPATELKIAVIEAVIPTGMRYKYLAVAEAGPLTNGEPLALSSGEFEKSPFINFRWLKAPGEIYGRSPIMKTLPDIKTANKVVELVLKNATIAVTGIWQADDDGVLNPATIKLVPGTIIPKAVGSAGLTALKAPGEFNVSQLILKDLRDRIRHGMMVDQLGQPNAPRMSATEVVERSAEMARVLGATHGRLQSELLTPLISRAMAILKRWGIIDDILIDGDIIDLEYKSPLARQQAKQNAQNTLQWLDTVKGMGSEAQAVVDLPAAARWLGKAFGVPAELMLPPSPVADNPLSGLISQLGDALPPVQPPTGQPTETNPMINAERTIREISNER